MLQSLRLWQLFFSDAVAQFSCDEIVDLFEDVPNGGKLQRGTVQNSEQDPQFVFLDTFSQSIAATYDCQIICRISPLRKELINKVSYQLNALLLDQRVERIIEHRLEDLFDQSFDMREAVDHLGRIFVQI